MELEKTAEQNDDLVIALTPNQLLVVVAVIAVLYVLWRYTRRAQN